MPPTIPQWQVSDGYSGAVRTFEAEDPALKAAMFEAAPDRATIVTYPNGDQYLVMRVHPRINLVAQRKLT